MADQDSLVVDESTGLLVHEGEQYQSLNNNKYSPSAYEEFRLDSSLKNLIKGKLYLSHFLYVWNARIYEFGIVLFIVNLYPKDLLPPSLFALISTSSAIILSNPLTKFVNKGERLSVIKSTIFIQRSSAILSSLTLLLTFRFFQHEVLYKNIALGIVIICGVVERLSTIANKMSISRDWIVKICGKDQEFLLELNTKLRSIDLFCKLIGPFFISTFLTLTNHEITAMFFIFSFLISNRIEFSTLLNIYNSVPVLNSKSQESLDSLASSPSKPNVNNENGSYWENLKLFFKNPLSTAIVAVSVAYFTVLSFGNSTVAYLLSFDDITNFTIGYLKAISTVFELFGTMVVFPFLTRHISLINTGAVSITFEFLTLVPIAVGFILNFDKTRWLMCICIPFSRIGLWCYDLSLQNSIQIYITDDFERFNATLFEETFNNLFELLGYLSTLIFHKPEQFQIPATATVIVIGLSSVLSYVSLIRMRRNKVVTSE